MCGRGGKARLCGRIGKAGLCGRGGKAAPACCDRRVETRKMTRERESGDASEARCV